MTWLRGLCRLTLLACAFVILCAAIGALHPALDAFGIWLVYGTIGAAICVLALSALRAPRSAALAGMFALGGFVQLWPHLGEGTPGTDLTLRQHNLLYTNDGAGLSERLEGVDVLTLQEVEAAVPVVEALAPDWAVNLCGNLGVGAPAIATRLPVIERGCFEGGAWMRIDTAAGPATFVSLHLHLPWPWPQPDHMDRVMDDLAALPKPVIVAGDFNQGAWSHALSRIEAATDTAAVPGIDVTHTRRLGTIRMPIDHVLLPDGWSGVAEPGARYGSDHMVVTARLAWP